MKVKCRVLKRFNKHTVGEEITAPSRSIFDSWKAYGFVEEIIEEAKEAKPPVDKMVKESMNK